MQSREELGTITADPAGEAARDPKSVAVAYLEAVGQKRGKPEAS